MTNVCRTPRLLLTDPVYRRWAWGRLRHGWTAQIDSFTPHQPPGMPVCTELEVPSRPLPAVPAGLSASSALIGLGPPKREDPAWVPLTTALRALSALDHARCGGLPAGSDVLLAQHAQRLAGCLDYWGPRATTSDLAVEGLALYRLGLELGLPGATAAGRAVLVGEAHRAVAPSGLLREGSTVAQLRLAWVYIDAWLAARRARQADGGEFQAVARRLLGVLGVLTLPGGLPLMGDGLGVSIERLSGLLPGGDATGWLASLPPDEAEAVLALRESSHQPDWETLRPDGWLRLDARPWSGLWHASPNGWAEAMAHQDLGTPEIHYENVPVFVDPGEGPEGEEAEFRSAALHGGLQLDGANPMPDIQAAYSQAFRRDMAGAPPRLQAEADGVSLRFDGYRRLGGAREAIRRWTFTPTGMVLDDFVNGTGRFAVNRRLVTPLPAMRQDDGSVLLSLPDGAGLRVDGGQPAILSEGLRSLPDGGLMPIQVIDFSTPKGNLPYRGRLTVERV